MKRMLVLLLLGTLLLLSACGGGDVTTTTTSTTSSTSTTTTANPFEKKPLSGEYASELYFYVYDGDRFPAAHYIQEPFDYSVKSLVLSGVNRKESFELPYEGTLQLGNYSFTSQDIKSRITYTGRNTDFMGVVSDEYLLPNRWRAAKFVTEEGYAIAASTSDNPLRKFSGTPASGKSHLLQEALEFFYDTVPEAEIEQFETNGEPLTVSDFSLRGSHVADHFRLGFLNSTDTPRITEWVTLSESKLTKGPLPSANGPTVYFDSYGNVVAFVYRPVIDSSGVDMERVNAIMPGILETAQNIARHGYTYVSPRVTTWNDQIAVIAVIKYLHDPNGTDYANCRLVVVIH